MEIHDSERRRRSRNLRAKYRRWTKECRHLDEWDRWIQLFRELTEALPIVPVAITRLQPERSEDRLIDAALRYKLQDVESGDRVHWKPRVVEGPGRDLPVFVVDGNHRAHALLQSEVSVFVNVSLPQTGSCLRLSDSVDGSRTSPTPSVSQSRSWLVRGPTGEGLWLS